MATKIRKTPIFNVLELYTEIFEDHRGAFMNLFRVNENAFMQSWGNQDIAQVNLSRTKSPGMIRGLHLQGEPHSEAKLVRCLKGCVWDVVVDLRKDSVTYGDWHALELSPKEGNAIHIPQGCAHGFQVLEPESELLYLHSGKWVPECEKGVRWDDPTLAIEWPLPVKGLSDRDRNLPYLADL